MATTVATPTVQQLERRPGTLTTFPATDATPEIRFHDSDMETSYSFHREDGNEVGFALTHSDQLRNRELTVSAMEPANFDAIQQIDLSYAEARMLRAYLNRPEVGRWLDQQ